MKKLTLDVEDVHVETFETADKPRGSGTVFGHAFTLIIQYCDETRYRHCPPTEYNDCTYAYPDDC